MKGFEFSHNLVFFLIFKGDFDMCDLNNFMKKFNLLFIFSY